jgi:hypothetical protein
VRGFIARDPSLVRTRMSCRMLLASGAKLDSMSALYLGRYEEAKAC